MHVHKFHLKSKQGTKRGVVMPTHTHKKTHCCDGKHNICKQKKLHEPVTTSSRLQNPLGALFSCFDSLLRIGIISTPAAVSVNQGALCLALVDHRRSRLTEEPLRQQWQKRSKGVKVNRFKSTCMFPEQFCTQSATAASSLCFASLSFTWIRRTSLFTLSWGENARD